MLSEIIIYLCHLLLLCTSLTLLIAACVPDYLAGTTLTAEARLEQRLEYSVLALGALAGLAVLQIV